MTTRRKSGILRSRRSYHRGGRAGNRQELQCNIPSHITGERIADSADPSDQLESTQDLLDTQTQSASIQAVRTNRVLQRRLLQLRAILGVSLGTAAYLQWVRAMRGARATQGSRVSPRPPVRPLPQMVGVQKSRKRNTGVRRGSKGGAFRFPPKFLQPRRRLRRRRPNRFTFNDPEGAFFQPGEEGF